MRNSSSTTSCARGARRTCAGRPRRGSGGAPRVERVDDGARIDLRSRPRSRASRRTGGCPGADLLPARHVRTSRAGLEHGVLGIDRAASREQRDFGIRRKPRRLPKRGVRARERRVDQRACHVPRGLARRTPAADEHDVGERAEEAHEEAVGVAARRRRTRSSRHRRDRDDAVDASPRSSRTGRARRSRGRRRGARASSAGRRRGEPLVLVQDLQRLESAASDIGRELTRPLRRPIRDGSGARRRPCRRPCARRGRRSRRGRARPRPRRPRRLDSPRRGPSRTGPPCRRPA